MQSHGLNAGTMLHVQGWYRDLLDDNTIGLTEALLTVVAP